MRTRLGYALSVMGIALLCIGTAHAGQPPETKCEAGKNQESGKYAACLAKAEAKLLKTKGLCSVAATVCYRDEECLGVETCDKDTTKYGLAVTKCEDKYEAKWDKLTQKAVDAGSSCPDGLLREDVKEVIDECVSNVASGLAGEGLSDCPGDLATCGGDLTTCNGSLGTCNTSLSSCSSNLGTCNGSLATCTTDLGTAQSDLTTCNGDLGTCQTDLSQSQSDLTTCTGDLGTCTGDLGTCTGDLGTCNTNLASAQACGNGSIDGGEDCDQGDLNGGTCGGEGFAGGTLACGANCAYDTSGCYAARFVDNGDGTISDYETGLMWEKKADFDNAFVNCTSAGVCPDPHDADNRYTWSAVAPNADGTAYTVLLAQLNAGGGFATHTDWRLPTQEELQGIVDYTDSSSPMVNAAFDTSCNGTCTVTTCSCTAYPYHWSSSTHAVFPNDAWAVYFGFGFVNYAGKTATYNSVRAVRTGL